MALSGPLRVVEGEAGGRCLLYLSKDLSGSPRLHVTNACEFWIGNITPDELRKYFPENGLDSSQDGISKLREALECRTPILTVHDSAATLHFQDGGQSVAFELYKAPLSEARTQLQDLMFGLVERVHALEKRVEEVSAAAAPSPVKNPEKTTLRSQSIFAPDISPPKRKTGAGQVSTKKRLPGESLINPGFKSKKTPTGVDFEDP